MKLQKLCYYSQALSLSKNSKKLFNENFEAWSNGPVCRELFNLHKC
ncbi:MAG: Panacea domain-containing protein [Alphaproteobacteria bacterium]